MLHTAHTVSPIIFHDAPQLQICSAAYVCRCHDIHIKVKCWVHDGHFSHTGVNAPHAEDIETTSNCAYGGVHYLKKNDAYSGALNQIHIYEVIQ